LFLDVTLFHLKQRRGRVAAGLVNGVGGPTRLAFP
jgi:hypothetical protein